MLRTQEQTIKFNQSLIAKYTKTCNHSGDSLKNGIPIQLCLCECKKEIMLQTRLYKYNIPQKFWFKNKKDVHQSIEVFNDVVLKYCANINKVLKNGLGIFFLGDNGTGKSLFMSYIAKQIAYKTNYQCYYITMPLLIQTILASNGFDDQSKELRTQLNHIMMNYNFIFIDEMNKGAITPSVRTYIEMILRHRHDNKLPFIIASNTSLSDLIEDGTDSGFGATVRSLLEGSCEFAVTNPGDYRGVVYEKLSETIYSNSQQQKIEVDEI